MCTALLPSPSDTWTVPAAAPAATTPCPPSAAATGSATAAPARTGDGSTPQPLPSGCECQACRAMFRTPLELVSHWNAEHRAAWIAKHADRPGYSDYLRIRLSVGLPLVDQEVMG